MDILIIVLIVFAYWELMGILVFAWTYIRASIERYDIQSHPYIRSGGYFKGCLILGPLMLIIFAIAEIQGFILWWRREKQ